MTRQTLQQAFPAPLMVGERDADLPVWPIFKQDATATVLVGYAFESIDFAPVPGFSGTPMNLLVMLDPKGQFIDVRVLSHHEPVFLDGLGEAPLLRFVEQYKGLSLMQNIKIGSNLTRADKNGSVNVYIDGVAKATASVRILNQSLLSAALKVARAKLGYAAGHDPDLVGHVRTDIYTPMDWGAMLRQGLVRRLAVSRREVERAFAGTVGEGQTPAGDGGFVDLYLAYLSVPSVGRNLLSEKGWQHLLNRIDANDHALLVVTRGDYSFVGENFVRGAVPDRLTLHQGELPLELRDLDLDEALRLPPELSLADAKVFRVIGPAGLDPAQPLDLALRVTRSKGMIYPERASRDFTLRYQLPVDYVQASSSDNKSWRSIWIGRAWELALIAVALALLSVALARQSWLGANERRLARFRTVYLVFTLVFIGWYAQGQLSIVNLTALLQALIAKRKLDFFLYDPVSLVLWAFVAATLVIWGRGTFCGWLCPFGALQELVSQIAQRLGIARIKLHRRLDARLKLAKYAVLAAILATAAVSGPWTDRVVEFEPFKTAITLAFVRSWPFVLWAGSVVLLSAFVYKGYCRYLCPLGAWLALLGRL
ncbi:MAG TPA: 4Fe-4S binding protein, partial [Methylibium sp.]